MPDLATVTVSWNSADTLGACLGALRRSAELAGLELEMIVVDNASGDGSVALAEAQGALVISNSANVGFAFGVNQGLAAAAADWVFLANPDLVVDHGFFRALRAALGDVEQDEEVGSLVPDVRFAGDVERINHRGVQVDEVGVPFEIAAGTRATADAAPVEVFGGSGGAWLLRRSALEAVGGLEPAFFAYLEDVELAWRLRRAGYRSLVVPEAVAFHEGSASTGATSPLKAHLVARNRRLLFSLHGPRGSRATMWRAITEAGHTAVQTALSRSLAPVTGRLEAVRFWPYEALLRRSYAADRLLESEEVPLAARTTLRDALRRKLTSTRHYRGGGG